MKARIWLLAILASGAVLAAQQGTSRQVGSQVKDFKPVTDAILQNPDPADWINWRRTLDGWGYSPLKQINKQNVQQLQLAWSWTLGPGMSEPTPLVYDGVMYLPSPDAMVQALDAATGEFLWEYKKEFEAPPGSRGMMRNLAIYDDKIYVPTRDAHIVALNARTGKLVWDQTVADGKLGWAYGSGPIVVQGKIVVGINGCKYYRTEPCFISAHDPQTGKELWRRYTVARPGEPGDETWGSLPLMARAGSDAWVPGSYDPKMNLTYWSTSQAKPWARFQRGDDGDALYTNSTLALDPETGKIVWYYQFLPGETHDMDEVFENILIDHDGRSSVFKMGKLAILWENDRKTGKFVAAHDPGYQTIVKLNPETGRVTYRDGVIPKPGVEVDVCPAVTGFKSWRAMAYHPETQAFYIPMMLQCTKTVFNDAPKQVEGGYALGGIKGGKNYFHPESPDGLGEFLAMNIKGKVLWRHRTRTQMGSAALTTGGGLVVVGDWDRYLYIHDAASGKILFQTRLSTSAQGFPITYAVRGKQYIAMPVGTGDSGWGSNALSSPLTPEKHRPAGGNAIFVFALPDSAATR